MSAEVNYRYGLIQKDYYKKRGHTQLLVDAFGETKYRRHFFPGGKNLLEAESVANNGSIKVFIKRSSELVVRNRMLKPQMLQVVDLYYTNEGTVFSQAVLYSGTQNEPNGQAVLKYNPYTVDLDVNLGGLVTRSCVERRNEDRVRVFAHQGVGVHSMDTDIFGCPMGCIEITDADGSSGVVFRDKIDDMSGELPPEVFSDSENSNWAQLLDVISRNVGVFRADLAASLETIAGSV